jgi:hypothetical protein
MPNDAIRSLVEELAAMVRPGERIKLLEAEIRLRQRWGGNRPYMLGTPKPNHPGGCYTWRYFGERRDPSSVRCASPCGEHVLSRSNCACAFWQRGEPGAHDAYGVFATYRF